MKRILLASASIVAFAGAAAAEISFNGEAALGYNDTESVSETDDDDGFYWDAELGITFSQELDNGLTAAATVTSDVVDNQLEGDIFAEGYVLSLTSETAGLFFGDTDMAANLRWDGVSEMAHDGFSETDGETVLRGDFMAYGFNVSLSGLVDDTTDGNIEPVGDTLDQYSVGVAGSFGAFEMSAAYQEKETDFSEAADIDNGDYNPNEIFGISVGTAFAGADVDVAYAREEDAVTGDAEDSTGIEVAFPIGPVTLGAFYVAESDQDDGYGVAVDYVSGALTVSTAWENVDDSEDWAIEAGYDMGQGLNFYAGVADAGDDYYVATTYELAEGAQLLVSYGVDDNDDSEDEIGDPEYQEGTTVEVSFEF
ncbi:MAG: porin [Limimaricola soesokkakensis]|uniref:porin n=1 Tax=Limimaricola soesokkakensis TaxID=1343159 RepID=UPI004059AB42